MAIKKGAFEAYTKERDLPQKGDSLSKRKKNSIFDYVEYSKADSNAAEGKNGSQTVHKESVVEGANGSQTVHKESVVEGANGSQALHVQGQSTAVSGSQIQYLGEAVLSKLSQNQRKIILCFYKDILTRGDFQTQEMTLDKISILSGVNKNSLKCTLHRMIRSGLITRTEYKDGRGGWSKYLINQGIKFELQKD